MKTFLTSILPAVMLLAWSALASGQVTVTETTTTQAGTVTEYAPGGQRLIVRSEPAASPITYAITRQTAFVDEAGAPLLAERVVPGVPITVQYVREGDTMVAARVVVRQPVAVRPAATATVVAPQPVAAATVTTTTGSGTVTQFVPGTPNLILRSTASAEPLSYAVTKTTTFVDEAGVPVAVDRIAAGLPVTVHYVQEGDRLVASRVIVLRQAPVEVIREVDVDDDDD